jgi:rubrerythrin
VGYPECAATEVEFRDWCSWWKNRLKLALDKYAPPCPDCGTVMIRVDEEEVCPKCDADEKEI